MMQFDGEHAYGGRRKPAATTWVEKKDSNKLEDAKKKKGHHNL
jgi:hypothetical protein